VKIHTVTLALFCRVTLTTVTALSKVSLNFGLHVFGPLYVSIPPSQTPALSAVEPYCPLVSSD
jgi:hypothetical protein